MLLGSPCLRFLADVPTVHFHICSKLMAWASICAGLPTALTFGKLARFALMPFGAEIRCEAVSPS